MLEIAVIADDLTGAADTGIQFRALYADALLMPDNGLAARPPQPVPQVRHDSQLVLEIEVHGRTPPLPP